MLSKDQISAAYDRPREWLPVQDWTPAGETFDATKHGVYVGTMSAGDLESYEMALSQRKEGEVLNIRALLAVRCVQNADGSRVFADTDADWLGQKAFGPLDDIADIALRLNKRRKDDYDQLVKN